MVLLINLFWKISLTDVSKFIKMPELNCKCASTWEGVSVRRLIRGVEQFCWAEIVFIIVNQWCVSWISPNTSERFWDRPPRREVSTVLPTIPSLSTLSYKITRTSTPHHNFRQNSFSSRHPQPSILFSLPQPPVAFPDSFPNHYWIFLTLSETASGLP